MAKTQVVRTLSTCLAVFFAACATGAYAGDSSSPNQPDPQPHRSEAFLGGGFGIFGLENNDYTNGFHLLASPNARIGTTYELLGQSLLFEGTFVVNGFKFGAKQLDTNGTISLQPAGVYHEDIETAHVGIKLAQLPVYAGVETLYASPPAPSSTQPDLVGTGFGFEAVPDLRRTRSFFGRLYYFPNIEAEDLLPFNLRYIRMDYEAGYASRVGRSNGFFTVSLDGDHRRGAAQMPAFAPAKYDFTALDTGYLMRI